MCTIVEVGRRKAVPVYNPGTEVFLGRRHGTLWSVWICKAYLSVTACDGEGHWPTWSCRWYGTHDVTAFSLRRELMASKWINAAVTKRAKKVKITEKLDAYLSDKRPALTDFLTDLEGEKGKSRELSVLMVSVCEDGIRCGLKDEEAGGWCWRLGDTLSEALDAIEKALTTHENPFRSSAARRSKK